MVVSAAGFVLFAETGRVLVLSVLFKVQSFVPKLAIHKPKFKVKGFA